MKQNGFKTLIILFILIILSGCSASIPRSKKEKHQTIAFYNVDRLYDTQNDPSKNDQAFLPDGLMKWDETRYGLKINALAATIENMGGKGGPAIIGLTEVENRQVLEDLIKNTPLRKHKYEIVHHDSPDDLGLDVALLYKPTIFKLTSQRSIPIKLNERNVTTRDILEVKGTLWGEPVTVYVNHWPSGKESRKRTAAATLRTQLDAQLSSNPEARIIVLGDFDEAPSSSVMRQALQASGRPDPAYKKELFNTHYIQHVQGNGSYYGRNGFVMLDQILLSKAWLAEQQRLRYVRGSATIHNPPALRNLYGKYKNTPRPTFSGTTYLGGASNHFPVYIKVQKVK